MVQGTANGAGAALLKGLQHLARVQRLENRNNACLFLLRNFQCLQGMPIQCDRQRFLGGIQRLFGRF